MATPNSPGRTSLVASLSENTSPVHLPSKVSVWMKQTAIYTGVPPHRSWVDDIISCHSNSEQLQFLHKRSYPVRSNESVSLVTNELPANFNDLPEVVLIKMRI